MSQELPPRKRRSAPSGDYSAIVGEVTPESTPARRRESEATVVDASPEREKKKRNVGAKTQRDGAEEDLFSFFKGDLEKLIGLKKHITVTFDGACRGNQTKEKKASCGACAWVMSGDDKAGDAFDFRMSKIEGDKPTNNKAELRACIMAVRLAAEIAGALKETPNVIIKGDSLYVVSGVLDGKLATITKEKSAQINWEEWNELRRAVLEADCVFEWRWIPRCLNEAADECANAALDDKDINRVPLYNKVPWRETSHAIQQQDLWDYWTCTTRSACKFLSPYLHDSWRKLFFALLHNALSATQDVEAAWFSVIAAPMIYLFPQPKASQRTFLSRVSDINIATKVFSDTLTKPTAIEKREFPSKTLEQSVEYLVSCGKSSRACELLEGKVISVMPATKPDAVKTWPEAKYDNKLLFKDTDAMDIAFAQIVAAVRGMRNGKAADLGGWTKELFSVLLRDISDINKQLIEMFFTKVANMAFPEVIVNCLRSDKGLYIGDERKKRGVSLSSFFSKVLWRMTFDRNPNHFLPQSIFGAVARVQFALDTGKYILKTDGSNAFFNVDRRKVFNSLQHIECPLLRAMWNFSYGSSSKVVLRDDGARTFFHDMSTGVKAGCASGSKLFIKGLESITSLPGTPAIVDDIYFINEADKDRNVAMEEARNKLSVTGIEFFGPKTRFISASDEPLEMLGGVVLPNSKLPINATTTKIINPVLQLLRKLAGLQVSKQAKFVMFNTILLRMKYMFRATHLVQCRAIAEQLDLDVQAIFKEVFGLQAMPSDRTALIHLPVEHGGLGIAHFLSLSRWYWSKQIDEMFFWTPEQRKARYSPGFDPSLTEAGATLVGTLALQDNIIVKSVLAIKKAPSAHIIRTIPRENLKLEDKAFMAMLFSKLQYLPTFFTPACEITAGHDLYAHMVECGKCRQGAVRHNAVAYELMRCIPKIGFVVSQSTSHLPLPKHTATGSQRLWSDKTVAGPDMIVYAGSDVHAIDFTIVNPAIEGRYSEKPRTRDTILRAVQKKKETYVEWEETYKMSCKAFVMTTNGFFGYDTVALLEQYAKDRGTWFPSWTQLRLQKVMYEAIANILTLTVAKKRAAPFTAEALSQRPT